MTTCRLDHAVTEPGVIIRCKQGEAFLPYESWRPGQVALSQGGPARLGILNQLLEAESARLEENSQAVFIPHSELARLDRWQAEGIGLPAPLDARLVLDTHGLLSSPNFRVQYGFVRHDGLPLHGYHREGAFLVGPNSRAQLPDPLYSIAEKLDAYIQGPIESMDDRLLWWSGVKDLLPDDAELGNYLRTINIVRPDKFSLRFRQGEDGIDFSPVFVTQTPRADGSEDEEPKYETTLPPVVQDEFTRRFRNQLEVGRRYALPHGWMIVLPATLCAAVQVVMDINRESPSRRLGFLRNPRAEIRSRLEAHLGDAVDEEELESLFAETPAFLSERVLGLGAWEPKSGTYIKTKAGAPWFPGEEPPAQVGIPVGPDVVTFPTSELEQLLKALQTAREQGAPQIEFGGRTVPVTPQIIDNVKKCISIFSPPVKPSGTSPEPEDKPGKKSTSRPLAPEIADNLDALGYSVEPEGLRKSAEVSPPLAPGIVLHTHQLTGLDWLKAGYRHGLTGALLADDMGLGKTIQTLAFLGWIREQVRAGFAPSRPFLVVAPKTLLENWVEECRLFLAPPDLGPLVRAHGAPFRDMARQEPDRAVNELKECGWAITNYETLRDLILVFGQVRWGSVIFDEAQRIKNPRAMVTDMAKALKADFTLALTGTPVENSLQDLWCIVDTVQPGGLGALKQFVSEYSPSDTVEESTLLRLKAKLEKADPVPIMIRRNKEQHWAERPEKKEAHYKRNMPPIQAQIYSQVVASAAVLAGRQGGVLEALQGLRATSLHPTWHSYDGTNGDAYIAQSARLTSCFEILDNVHARGEKALVFVEFREMQAILSELLEQRYGCAKVPIINGQIRGPLRQERVHAFQGGQSGFDVILLSPKAAGLGLTLTAATHVIHLTRWWNPAVEDQCSDRAYRIGQRRPVTIYHLLAIHPEYGQTGSFDYNLHQLLERKRHLSRTLLAPPAPDEGELKGMLNATLQGAQVPEGQAPMGGCSVEESHVHYGLMEPEEFELWVLRQFRGLGYQTRSTQKSWDAGADGMAIAPDKSGLPNLIIQCKHTQSANPLGQSAVLDVLRARDAYAKMTLSARLIVVTNAVGFSYPAQQSAQEHQILLFTVQDLTDIENLRCRLAFK